MIVAENNNHPSVKLWVEAIPFFNSAQTAVDVEFWFFGQRGNERSRHTTVTPGVIEAALADGLQVVASAAVDQFAWLERNFAEISAPIYQAHQQRVTPAAPPSGRSSSI